MRQVANRYRKVENHHPDASRQFAHVDLSILHEAALPVYRLTIQRPSERFAQFLGLTPGICAEPDWEFIFRLFTGERSHQSSLRMAAGLHFKNLENHLRGRHQLTTTTLSNLVAKLDIDEESLHGLVHGNTNGALLPVGIEIFRLIEALPIEIMSGFLDVDTPCSCCGKSLVFDLDTWWSHQDISLGASERRFVERLLHLVSAAKLVETGVARLLGNAPTVLNSIEAIGLPDHYPIGNWLSEVQAALGCKSLSSLADLMQLRPGNLQTLTHTRLKKWSSGQEMMPFTHGKALSETTDLSLRLRWRLMAARIYSLAIDFLIAATISEVAPSKAKSREVVYQRIVEINRHIAIATSQRQKLAAASTK